MCTFLSTCWSQWGTVREDYSDDGKTWAAFSHDDARAHAYRWGEDGIFGLSDDHQKLCFAPAFWNGKDSIIKERFFGLPGMSGDSAGNHGEDVKEYFFYLDNTPTHSYMKALYKYPQNAFPYPNSKDLLNDDLYVHVLGDRNSKAEPELELIDTGVFDRDGYYDIFVEYAKKDQRDILIEIRVVNRNSTVVNRNSTGEHDLHNLPTLWFRNTWTWDKHNPSKPVLSRKPVLSSEGPDASRYEVIEASWREGGAPQTMRLYCETSERFSRFAISRK